MNEDNETIIKAIKEAVQGHAASDAGSDPAEFEPLISVRQDQRGLWTAAVAEYESGLEYRTAGHASETLALKLLLVRVRFSDPQIQLRAIETKQRIEAARAKALLDAEAVGRVWIGHVAEPSHVAEREAYLELPLAHLAQQRFVN